MGLLTEKVFCYHFGNQPQVKEPRGRRKTYVCYQLKLLNDTVDQGSVKNKHHHVELRFIDKIRSLDLDRTQWSPCPHCAGDLVAIIADHPHVSLQSFASRLYCHWQRLYQQGLQHLWKSDIPVWVTAEREFADCWDNFVDNQARPFQPWEKLQQYSNNAE